MQLNDSKTQFKGLSSVSVLSLACQYLGQIPLPLNGRFIARTATPLVRNYHFPPCFTLKREGAITAEQADPLIKYS